MVEPGVLVEKIWPWRDWYSRLIVKKILSYFLSKSLVSLPEPEYASTTREVGEVGQEVDLVRDLKELKTTVSELASALAEIKAILADLTGPYSLYRPREEVKPQITTQPAPQTTSSEIESTTTTPRIIEEARREKPQVIEKPEVTPSTPPTRSAPSELRELAGILSEASRVIREERATLTGVALNRMLLLMKTTYELMKYYPRSSVERILELIENLKIVSSDEAKLIKTIIDTVEQSIKENITPEENTLLIYLFLRNMGIREEALEEEVLKTIVNMLTESRRRKTIPPEQQRENQVDNKGDGYKWGSQQQ